MQIRRHCYHDTHDLVANVIGPTREAELVKRPLRILSLAVLNSVGSRIRVVVAHGLSCGTVSFRPNRSVERRKPNRMIRDMALIRPQRSGPPFSMAFEPGGRIDVEEATQA
jgi:hypothetical protein